MSTVLEVETLNVEIASIALGRSRLHPVRDVSFAVDAGETVSLVGESGSGKTLTALALIGLLPKGATRTAGRLKFRDVDLLRLPGRQLARLRGNDIGMIFQDPMTSLNPVFTIGEQMIEGFVRHGHGNRRQARDRAVALLDKVEIPLPEQRLSQYPHQLSGGMRQRVMIAMALMCSPALLIADEPTTALDVTIQAQVLRLLRSLRADFGLSMVLITHDMGVVANVADRVFVMYGGQIVEGGSIAEVFRRPLHPYTAGLLECAPIPGQTPPGETLNAIPGIVPLVTTETSGCVFRDRCRYAEDGCREATIPLADDGTGHLYRCVLAPKLRRGEAGLDGHG